MLEHLHVFFLQLYPAACNDRVLLIGEITRQEDAAGMQNSSHL